jgi:Holliday junction resolvase-like predicted endonuclease
MFWSMGPRQQGDLGEVSAMEWLASQGASVYFPVGHSPDVDVVAWWEGRFVGVQVKTAGGRQPSGNWTCTVCTRGGNQSWNGITKHFAADRCDYLFVLAGDGRRWFIPSDRVEGRTAIILGGSKYAEWEVAGGRPFLEVAA